MTKSVAKIPEKRDMSANEIPGGNGWKQRLDRTEKGNIAANVTNVVLTVGDNVFCDDIILESGEVALHNHPYSVTFIKRDVRGRDVFTDMCHLGYPA